MVVVVLGGRGEAQLAENFYSSTCSNVESIVRQAVSTKFTQTFVTIPATLRLFFHDCFVEVCFSTSCISLIKSLIYIYNIIIQSLILTVINMRALLLINITKFF